MKQGILFILWLCISINYAQAQSEIPEINETIIKPHINQTVWYKGKVHGVFESKGKNIMLNMDGKYPNQKLTIVVFAKDVKNFTQNLKAVENKTIRIKGKIILYKGKPEIILKNPDNLSMVE